MVMIYSQSLKNEDTDDFTANGAWSNDYALLADFRTDFLEKTKFKSNAIDMVQYKIFHEFSFDPVCVLKIYCEQKDICGRNSPILIKANLSELDKIPGYLDHFLDDCAKMGSKEKRTVAITVRTKLKRKIKQITSTRERLKIEIGIMAVIVSLILLWQLWQILTKK